MKCGWSGFNFDHPASLWDIFTIWKCSIQSWTGHWITLSLASKLASPLSLIIKRCLQSNFMYSLLRHWLATSGNDCAWPASLCSRSLNSCWTIQWITCFLSTGHHPGTVNSQKYLCNPSSDIEIKWLHRNFDEAHFWGVWDNLNFHWFNGWSMTVTNSDMIWYSKWRKSEATSLCWSTSRGALTLQVHFTLLALQQSKLEKWSVTRSVTWRIPWSTIVDCPSLFTNI